VIYLKERDEIIVGHKDGKIAVFNLKHFTGSICNTSLIPQKEFFEVY
jgi:hypothetical protein